MGAPHDVCWSKSFVSALKQIFHLFLSQKETRQVCNLFQRPVEQILGFYPKGLSAKKVFKKLTTQSYDSHGNTNITK